MIHILNNIHGYNASWCFEEFKKIIKPEHKIAIIAFAFRDSKIPNAEVWETFYGWPNGTYYQGFVNVFKDFGIAAEQIEILNYYKDTPASAQEKIRKADILYFLGGLPDVMLARLEEFGLVEAIREHKGIVIGYSAGAVIQLGEYHLSPDEDYAEFGYYPGLGFLDGFYVEVHYEGLNVQIESIQRVMRERRKPVYAVGNAGALIVDETGVKTIGDVTVFDMRVKGLNNVEVSSNEMIDSRCGLHCTGCEYKETCSCGGCIETNGNPFHGECPVAVCCQEKGIVHCGECPDIPCELLMQYSCDPEHGDTPQGARIEQCKRWYAESRGKKL